MKKIGLLLILSLFVLPMAFAVGPQDGNNAGNGTQIETNQQTMNQGEATMLQTQNQVRAMAGNYMNQNGEMMQIKTENGIQLRVRDVEAHSELELNQEMVQNQTRLHVQLSNGQNSEIKVMPDAASETAMNRLRLHVCNESNNCTLVLKEVGQGDQVRAAYEVKAQKQVKVLGMFGAQMQVQAQIDAENGNVVQENRPWWSFLATDAEE